MPVKTAILLAAGLGTRLRPLTNSIPKCLVPINGKPLLYYWIDNLVAEGVSQIFINTHYFAEKVVAAIKQHPNFEQIQLVHETELLGTAGTVRHILNTYNVISSNVLIAHADNLCFCNWLEFFEYHTRSQSDINVTMMAFKTDTPSSCGILELDQKNRLLAFHEKVAHPPGNLANGAVYLFSSESLDVFRVNKLDTPDISLDIIPSLIAQTQVWQNTVYLRDIGTTESYQQANEDMKCFLYREN